MLAIDSMVIEAYKDIVSVLFYSRRREVPRLPNRFANDVRLRGAVEDHKLCREDQLQR